MAKLADPAELVLSELFTNSLVHGDVPEDRQIGTRYARTPSGGVLIEVHDADERRPVPQLHCAEAESGRGLELVNVLTGGCWGVTGRQGVGKRVWAIVSDNAVCEADGGAE
ncbi:ATP-binding protein [Streptomyces sp. NBC_01190]|uniref:ATP-binding protein n=1 Tax=Streptomyces sp. NBC_01190 TaxID=2903767 RepID=UPI0038652D9D|nr:ATP-binding protein [Streptomyces sp. NBC_01190]